MTDVSGILNDTYEYDDNGNRIGEGHVTNVPNRLVDDGQYQYDYDNEGNLWHRFDSQSARTLTFTWDHRNRLTKIEESEFIPTGETLFELVYEYDLFNRRVARTKTITAEGGEGQAQTTTTAEKFVYDDDDVVLDFYKPDGGSFSLARRYLYGPAADQLFAQENVAEDIGDPDRVYWMLTDNLGTVRDIIDHAGTLIAGGHFKYDAFGNILSGDKTLTRYLYTAREYDSTTGLQYNRERWYDSNTGRWLSEDPIGFNGDPSNLYLFGKWTPKRTRTPQVPTM